MTNGFHLAQINISRPVAALDSAELKDFVEALDPVNAAAEVADGFVWRLQTDDGNATDVTVFDDPGLIVNLTVWRDVESLKAYMFAGMHREFLSRRREFFHRPTEPMTALWWVPEGHLPEVSEGEKYLVHLREHGPTATAFTLTQNFPPPTA